MKVLLERAESEIIVKKSRFIAIALKAESLEKVKDIVKEIRAEHPKANHVVHAAVIGKNGTLYSSSDDKEPKNTAGRPALEVVKGSGITNITVAIVRYFGGTLLGTGGLVKAYSDSAKAVLSIVHTEELIEKAEFSMTLPYNAYTLIKRLLDEVSAEIIKEDFDINITIKGRVPSANLPKLQSEAMDIGQGRILLS